MRTINPQMRSYATLRERRTSAELQRLLPEELYLRLEGALLEVKKKTTQCHPSHLHHNASFRIMPPLLNVFLFVCPAEGTDAEHPPHICCGTSGPYRGAIRASGPVLCQSALCRWPPTLLHLRGTHIWGALAGGHQSSGQGAAFVCGGVPSGRGHDLCSVPGTACVAADRVEEGAEAVLSFEV